MYGGTCAGTKLPIEEIRITCSHGGKNLARVEAFRVAPYL